MIRCTVLFLTLALVAQWLSACGGTRTTGRGLVKPAGSVLVHLASLEPADKQTYKLRYQLVCDGLDPIPGTEAPEHTNHFYFSNHDLMGGILCAVEVRAKSKQPTAFEWLTEPKEPGLFYASTKQAIQKAKLNVSLYRVFRAGSTGTEDADSPATLEKGARCEHFDLSSRMCLDEALRLSEDDQMAELAPLGMVFRQGIDGLSVHAVMPNSPAHHSAIRPGDRILRVNQQDVSRSAELAQIKLLARRKGKRAFSLDLQRDGEVIRDVKLPTGP